MATNRRKPLVIVNADDWGADPGATDAILDCFVHGAITSTSAMVYMVDSSRAAEMASHYGLPVGLHINLSTPYDAADVSDAVRRRQIRMTRLFSPLRLKGTTWMYSPRRLLYYPCLRRAVDLCVADQLERFLELYGRGPTHFDGHHDVQMCPTVLLSRTMPPGSKVRVGARRGPWSLAVSARFISTDAYVSIRELAPWGVDDLPTRIAKLKCSSIEVSCHPKLGDSDVLLSIAWKEQISGLNVGSFEDLH